MGTNECSQPASKSSWDSHDFGDVNMVLKCPILASPPGHNELKQSQSISHARFISIMPFCPSREINERVSGLNQLFDLNQMHREPTREDRLLDLFFTNKPNLVKASRTIPGLSDHEIVMVDSDIKAHINIQDPRHIRLWSKEIGKKIKDEASDFRLKFLDNIGNYSVNANYVKFKNFINGIINKHVPTRAMRSPKHNLPWITQKIRRMCRKNNAFSTKLSVLVNPKIGMPIRLSKTTPTKPLGVPIGNMLITSYWRDFSLRIVNLSGAMSNLSARTQ